MNRNNLLRSKDFFTKLREPITNKSTYKEFCVPLQVQSSDPLRGFQSPSNKCKAELCTCKGLGFCKSEKLSLSCTVSALPRKRPSLTNLFAWFCNAKPSKKICMGSRRKKGATKRSFNAPTGHRHVRHARFFVWVHQEYGLIFVRKSKICMGSPRGKKLAVKAKKGFLKYGLRAISKTKRCHFSPSIFWYSTYKTNYTIVRPLMNFLRCNITSLCRKSKLPVSPDFSNFKIKYSRNRIRKQIVPTLKTFFNPKIEKALSRFSEAKDRP